MCVLLLDDPKGIVNTLFKFNFISTDVVKLIIFLIFLCAGDELDLFLTFNGQYVFKMEINMELMALA